MLCLHGGEEAAQVWVQTEPWKEGHAPEAEESDSSSLFGTISGRSETQTRSFWYDGPFLWHLEAEDGSLYIGEIWMREGRVIQTRKAASKKLWLLTSPLSISAWCHSTSSPPNKVGAVGAVGKGVKGQSVLLIHGTTSPGHAGTTYHLRPALDHWRDDAIVGTEGNHNATSSMFW